VNEQTEREALIYATGYSDAIRHMVEDAAERQERAAYRVAELNPRRDEEGKEGSI